MLKIYILMASLLFFLIDSGLALELNNFSDKSDSVVQTAASSKVKRRRRKRRKKPRRKPTRKKRTRRKRPDRKKITTSKRDYKQGFYAVGGLQYFMPAPIDFTPVVAAGSSSAIVTNAELVHTGGIGINVGAGYRFLKYLSAEFDLFLVYPVIGSQVSLERDLNGAPVEAVADGAKVVIPRIFVKGIYPLDSMKIDFYAAGGAGYTQILKTVGAEQEGVALAGISFHGLVGADFELSPTLSVGGSFEYMSISYSYVDIWEPAIYDSTSNDAVSVSQSIMVGGINITYRF